MPSKLLLVVVGSGLGGGLRYLLGGLIQTRYPTFPVGTITINITGSYLIALISYLSITGGMIGPDVRLALTTGIMGGYTTYSTFNYESLSLFQRNDVLLGMTNIVVTVIGALIAGWLGVVTGRLVVGH